MKAAIFRGIGKPLTIEDIDIAQPEAHEVLIKVAASGLCHSELHVFDGSLPMPSPGVFGHEAAGIVEAVGSQVKDFAPGDHVISCLSMYCGHCKECLTGHMSICLNLNKLLRDPTLPPVLSKNGEPLHQGWGLAGFAEKMLVHEHGIVKIDKDIPLDLAALLGCGVTTGLGAVLNAAKVPVGSTVAVIGCGGVGINCIQGARLAGATRIIAIDRVPSKLASALKFGATDVIDASKENCVEKVMELTNGGVDYSFEVIGKKESSEQCFNMLAPGGTATLVGVIPVGTTIELMGISFLFERKIQGTMLGGNRFPIDLPNYLKLYKMGQLNLDDLVTEHIRLEDINEGYEKMKTGEGMRRIIIFD